jgi:hypothetical protein
MTCRPNRATGSRTQLSVQEETCWGTLGENSDPVAAQNPIGFDFETESLSNQINSIDSALQREDRMRSAPQLGNQRPGGTISGELQPNGAWPLIMKHALGGSVTTNGSGPYVHEMEGDVTLPEGLSIQKKFSYPSGAVKYFHYLGSRVQQVEITAANEGIIKAAAEILAKSETTPIIPFDTLPAYPASNEPFNSFHGAIMLDSNADGTRTPISTLSRLVLRVNNSIDGDQFALDGSPYRADLPEDQRIVSGEVDAFFTQDNFALYERTIANDTVSMEFTISRGALSWQFTLPALKLRLQTPQAGGRGPLTLTSTFEGFRDPVLGTDIMLAITNNDPSISTAA